MDSKSFGTVACLNVQGPKIKTAFTNKKKLSSCLKIKITTYKTIILPIGILHLEKRTD